MVRDIGQVWLHPTISQRFLKVDLTGFSCSSVRCFHGLLLKREASLAYHMLLFMIWQIARTGTTSVLREGQERIAREVVLVRVTTSGDVYLLPGNTCNYQTANRKLKIVAFTIYPVKCHYNTSTHFSFLLVWHSAEVQRSGTAFPQLHFSSSNLLKSLYFLAGFQGLPLQMAFVIPILQGARSTFRNKNALELKQTSAMQYK